MKRKERSVLWAWAFSYIIILLIPAISGFINYRMNVRTVNQGIVKTYELHLDSLTENIDHLLTVQEECYAYVFQNEEFKYLNT